MIKFNAGQLRSMQRSERQRFIANASDFLRKRYSDRSSTMSDDALHLWIDGGIDHAANYGIVTENDVLQFLGIRMTLGAEFDLDNAFAWAVSELNQSGTPRRRMERIIERMAFDPDCKVPLPHE